MELTPRRAEEFFDVCMSHILVGNVTRDENVSEELVNTVLTELRDNAYIHLSLREINEEILPRDDAAGLREVIDLASTPVAGAEMSSWAGNTEVSEDPAKRVHKAITGFMYNAINPFMNSFNTAGNDTTESQNAAPGLRVPHAPTPHQRTGQPDLLTNAPTEAHGQTQVVSTDGTAKGTLDTPLAAGTSETTINRFSPIHSTQIEPDPFVERQNDPAAPHSDQLFRYKVVVCYMSDTGEIDDVVFNIPAGTSTLR